MSFSKCGMRSSGWGLWPRMEQTGLDPQKDPLHLLFSFYIQFLKKIHKKNGEHRIEGMFSASLI